MIAPMKTVLAEKTVVIFDSNCMLCSRFVYFLIRHDRNERLLFTDPSSSYFNFLVKTNQVKPPFETVYANYNGQLLQRSEAILHIISQLSWWGKSIKVFKIVPLSWRDKLYDYVARNRYQWFGKTDSCLLDNDSVKIKSRIIK